MAHHLRYQSASWATHHVVSRCIQGFGFLKPTKHTVNVCTGVLGYAVRSKKSKPKNARFNKYLVQKKLIIFICVFITVNYYLRLGVYVVNCAF